MKIRISKNPEKRNIGNKEYFMGEPFGRVIYIDVKNNFYEVDVDRGKEHIFLDKDIYLQSVFIYYPYTKEYEVNKKFKANSVY